ncbi:uncharacterized protein LOC125501931 [Athalia rosae]|uniref:uncharacterized protein LOC125501931 n=1 Tax=Athalia rosae TaxID=37344 RepID=UPI002034444D|nr:uncharacterized protein LOC125501653 isoform X2 [Athalia rosae]XP_048515063.1 uncharacterized protein LOC125501931 [Athalia rosae]XP_048515064.1 uncharacterized protein LOC125501931 [Athalia rosae]
MRNISKKIQLSVGIHRMWTAVAHIGMTTCTYIKRCPQCTVCSTHVRCNSSHLTPASIKTSAWVAISGLCPGKVTFPMNWLVETSWTFAVTWNIDQLCYVKSAVSKEDTVPRNLARRWKESEMARARSLSRILTMTLERDW